LIAIPESSETRMSDSVVRALTDEQAVTEQTASHGSKKTPTKNPKSHAIHRDAPVQFHSSAIAYVILNGKNSPVMETRLRVGRNSALIFPFDKGSRMAAPDIQMMGAMIAKLHKEDCQDERDGRLAVHCLRQLFLLVSRMLGCIQAPMRLAKTMMTSQGIASTHCNEQLSPPAALWYATRSRWRTCFALMLATPIHLANGPTNLRIRGARHAIVRSWR